jgi:myosin heavy subunit
VNPYRGVPIFNKEFIKLYYEHTDNQPKLPPHAYEVTNRALRQVCAGGRGQRRMLQLHHRSRSYHGGAE